METSLQQNETSNLSTYSSNDVNHEMNGTSTCWAANEVAAAQENGLRCNGVKRKAKSSDDSDLINSSSSLSPTSIIDTINEQTSRLGLQAEPPPPQPPQSSTRQQQQQPAPIVSTREKRVRKQKAFDDDFVMFSPLPSLFAPSQFLVNRSNQHQDSNGHHHQNGINEAASSSLSSSLSSSQQWPAASTSLDLNNNNHSPSPLTPPITEPCAFSVGDVVWAKLNSHSWWPCMISTPNLSNATSEKQAGRSLSEDIDSAANEPPGDSFIRYMSASRRHKRMLYVEFFGPLVEHAWVIEANVLAYPGGDPFEFFKDYGTTQIEAQSTKSMKEKMAQKYMLRTPPPPRHTDWESAVREANEALSKKSLDRKLAFIKKHSENGGCIVKGANKTKSTSTSSLALAADEFDDFEHHSDPFDIDKSNRSAKSKKRHLSAKEDQRSKLKLAKKAFPEHDNNSSESFDERGFKHLKKNGSLAENDDADAEEEDGNDENSNDLEKKRKRKPKPRSNENSVSEALDGEGDGLSEKQILRLVKNRISAITCMANNPLNLIRISKKYHISKQLIMKDYFGFTETSTDVEQEPIDEEAFVNKQAAAIVRDLDHVSQVVNNGLVAHEEYETVPRALVALKFRIPMVFIIKLGDYFAHKRSDLIADEENSAFFRGLLDLKRQLAQHRHDLKKLCEIIDSKLLPPGDVDVDVNLPKLEKFESPIVQVIKEEEGESQTVTIVNQI